MRLPRMRFTVRRTMLIVVALAVACALAVEFGEGVPPRYVVRGIPKRIARLRPGLTWEQTREILGLEESWLTGGTGAFYGGGDGNGHYMHEDYYLRMPRVVVVMKPVGDGNPAPERIFTSAATIQLWFSTVSTNIRPGEA